MTVGNSAALNYENTSLFALIFHEQDNGTTVGTVIASDTDAGQTKTFSIVSGNTSGAFSIIVKVQDNGTGNMSSQATITFSHNDVYESPVIATDTDAGQTK